MKPGKTDDITWRLAKAEDCFIGIDLGSTAIKCVAVSGAGRIIASASTAIQRLSATDNACFEIDPEFFTQSIFRLIALISSSSGKVQGISWVSASGNLLLLDDENKPLAPMISWLDERPLDGSIEDAYMAIDSDRVYRTVGWPLSRQFPFGRLLWLKKNKMHLIANCARICTSNDWLGYQLTGNWAIDRSTGSTMYVYDQTAIMKHEGNLSSLGLKAELFTDLQESGTYFGLISTSVQNATGLDGSTKAVLGSFDHPGAARALGIHHLDQLLLSCGTSWVGLVILPDRETGLKANLLLDPYESAQGGNWCGMFSLMGIGKRIDSWFDLVFATDKNLISELERNLAVGLEVMQKTKFTLMNQLVAAVDASGFIPEIDLVAMKPEKETVVILLSQCGPGAVFRGLMESAAFEFRRMLAKQWPHAGSMREISMVGGPANSLIWRQIVADTMNCTISVRFVSYAGAVGAAIMAASGTGYKLDILEPVAQTKPDKDVSRIMHERFNRFMERSV